MLTFVLASLEVSAPCCWRTTTSTASTPARCDCFGAGVASEDTSEGASKVRVKDGVDDRVEEAVEVAEPRDQAHDGWRDGATTASAAERPDRRDDEERKPTDDERPGDDGQRPCRLTLSPTTSLTFVVTTLFHWVAAGRRTSPRQHVQKILSVVKHYSLLQEFRLQSLHHYSRN